jgi:hypothetical protein
MPLDCYAGPLGDCSEIQTSEHYLSKGVLKMIGKAPIIEGAPGIATAAAPVR